VRVVPVDVSEITSAEITAAVRHAERTAEVVLPHRRLSQAEFERVLEVLPRDGGRRRASTIDLRGAVFSTRCSLADLAVTGPAYLNQARFEDGLDCARARLSQGLECYDTVVAAGEASFEETVFGERTIFFGASFAELATFRRASFLAEVRFLAATFGLGATFEEARFDGAVALELTTLDGNLFLSQASFRRARQLGPIRVDGCLALDRASFDEPVRIEVSARRVTCEEARFRAGMDLHARWADVAADGADFAGPSLITDLPARSGSPMVRALLGWERPREGGGWDLCAEPPSGATPRVISLCGAKVAQLTLSRVDLSACRFASAHGLDEMRLERVHFAQPPSGWRGRGRRWIRWTGRRTIAEEHRWRYTHDHGTGWFERSSRRASRVGDGVEPLEAAEVASIYRALRRGRERERDEPAAGAFYYGEMEMRRMRAGRPGSGPAAPAERSVLNAERALLTLYWLVAGYGLRASRAFIAFALVVTVHALPLSLWGFDPSRGYGRSLLFAAESSISLLREPEAKLTAGGEVLQIALRLAGPLFFGLAILALRNRVKR
jgi:hypothetical protein